MRTCFELVLCLGTQRQAYLLLLRLDSCKSCQKLCERQLSWRQLQLGPAGLEQNAAAEQAVRQGVDNKLWGLQALANERSNMVVMPRWDGTRSEDSALDSLVALLLDGVHGLVNAQDVRLCSANIARVSSSAGLSITPLFFFGHDELKSD